MNRICVRSIVVIALLAGLGLMALESPAVQAQEDPPSASVEVSEADIEALVTANNAFAIDLYQQLAQEAGNIFFSPYSIHSALTMTYAGARGETAAEMAEVLRITELGERVHAVSAELARRLKAETAEIPVEFHVANALWGQKGLPFQSGFLDLTREHYGARLRELDFAADTEGARRTINGWVAEQTVDQILELLKSGDLTSESRFVLTNAIYFQADWREPFSEINTREGEFFQTSRARTTMPFMFQANQFDFADVGSAQLLELPYVGESLVLTVVLPDDAVGLADLEESLTPVHWHQWITQLNRFAVQVTLPKIHLGATRHIKGNLKRMGMSLAFEDEGDFTGVTDCSRLAIDDVVHEAHLEWDEKGTEAVAATGVLLGGDIGIPAAHFTANRPFLFLIRERHSGTILFVGRFSDPTVLVPN